MRNWCAALAMSAFLALPLCAQHKKSGAGDEATSTAAEGSKPVATKGAFALPATPRPTPFPGPAAASADTRSRGTLVPRYELAGMYDYINFAPGDPFANSNSHGGSGSFTYNASRWIGLTGELGGLQHRTQPIPADGNQRFSPGWIHELSIRTAAKPS